MKRKIKACIGWYESVKYLERRMKCERETNNWRRIHGMPPQRDVSCQGSRKGKV